MKITAVVVTFNRLALLKECISGLKRQTVPLQEIVVVNNGSSDGTDVWLAAQEGLTVVTQENLGGAGGQYTGIGVAIDHGADWLWLMDDDAEPFADALEQLLPFMQPERGPVAALSCTVIDNDGKISLAHRGHFDYRSMMRNFGCVPLAESEYARETADVGYASFVGVMIARQAVEAAGLPRKEFFIHFDDIEYSLRLRKYGRILLVPASKILHKEVASNHFFLKRVFGKERTRIRYEKLWLRYYGIRNLTWGVKKYYGDRPDHNLVLAWFYIRSVFGILLFDDHKYKRIKFLTLSMRDGLSARFENGYDYITRRTKLYQALPPPVR